MPLRPIFLYPDPALLRPTVPVEEVDDRTRELVRDMIDTMYAAPGIGLAANQIGVGARVCIVDLTAGDKDGELRVFVNPEVQQTEGREIGEEGCLSFPDVSVDAARPFRVRVEALDLEGRTFELEAEDLLARAILHECEHLDGQTFLRHLSVLKRGLVKKQIRRRIESGDWLPVVTS